MCLNPLKCIEGMRKRRDYSRPLAYLAVASVLLGFSVVLGFNILSLSPVITMPAYAYDYARVFAVAAFGTFVTGLFISWAFSIGMNMLGGRGKFYEGLVSVAYPLKLLSIGVVITAVSSYAGLAGGIISFLALTTFGILGYTAMLRATKDMFGVDMITAFIGVSALLVVIMMAFYSSLMAGVF